MQASCSVLLRTRNAGAMMYGPGTAGDNVDLRATATAGGSGAIPPKELLTIEVSVIQNCTDLQVQSIVVCPGIHS